MRSMRPAAPTAGTATEDHMLRHSLHHLLHRHSHRMLALLGALALAITAAAKPAKSATVSPAAHGVTRDACVLQYQRADNMWAAFGRPDGNLGSETITVPASREQWFNTDWQYEKLRNDGVNYYGSHLRVATNIGAREVVLRIRTPIWFGLVSLQPGQSQQFQHDLTMVRCP
jgi:hypothetical protein